jgi:hypothetical protein
VLLFLGLAGAVASIQAGPVLYDLNFTTILTPPPTSGSFTHDSSAALDSQFANFIVNWNGLSYNLTTSANNPTEAGAGCTQAPTSATFFALLSGTPECTPATVPEWLGEAGAGHFFICEENQQGAGGCDNNQTGLLIAGSNAATGGNALGFGNLTITAVPEPSTFLVTLACGGVLFGRHYGRRKRRAARP